MTRPARRWCLLAALAIAALPLIGCDLGCNFIPYVWHVASNQLRIQGHTEPIDDVLASGRLSNEDAAKLRLIVAARDYAVNVIGLNAGDSYTTFYDTGGDPLAWNLSAARRDALIPITWSFPIVGEVPYLAFFDEDYLHQTEDDLIAQGYDTLAYELDAYSTLGYFEDPVRSTMLQRDELSLAETIIHEILHNTIWRAGDTPFNESLATFVGRTGAVDFLRAQLGDESGWPHVAEEYYADTDTVNVFLMQLYGDLEVYYGQPLDSDALIDGREAVFQAGRDRFTRDLQPTLRLPTVFLYYAGLPTNNAWMLAHHRYNLNLDVFQQVYDATGPSWPATLDIFRSAAGSNGDPVEYLENWLAGQAQ